jgi:hypothetical protein
MLDAGDSTGRAALQHFVGFGPAADGEALEPFVGWGSGIDNTEGTYFEYS